MQSALKAKHQFVTQTDPIINQSIMNLQKEKPTKNR
jgi:hypothetical protein